MEDLSQTAKRIRDAIEIETPKDDPGLIQDKIMELTLLTGSAAALQANAKKNLLIKEGELLKKYKGENMQASVLMRTINAECFEEAGWLTYCERLSAGISHSIEGLRSVLSYIKSELDHVR